MVSPLRPDSQAIGLFSHCGRSGLPRARCGVRPLGSQTMTTSNNATLRPMINAVRHQPNNDDGTGTTLSRHQLCRLDAYPDRQRNPIIRSLRFFMHRRNRPRLKFELSDRQEKSEDGYYYYQYWHIYNEGHDTALDVEATFGLTSQEPKMPKQASSILVKPFPLSRRGDMGPHKTSLDWSGLDFEFKKGDTTFTLTAATEVLEDRLIISKDVPYEYPVGKYYVSLRLSGGNLRDEDRAPRFYFLEFPEGAPVFRPEGEHDGSPRKKRPNRANRKA